MAFVAKKIFLTKGVGKHRERLSSFELALRNAGIAACNIVRVSSIFPPNCKLISRSEGGAREKGEAEEAREECKTENRTHSASRTKQKN